MRSITNDEELRAAALELAIFRCGRVKEGVDGDAVVKLADQYLDYIRPQNARAAQVTPFDPGPKTSRHPGRF